MNLFGSLKKFLAPAAGLMCPRCEKPLEGHDEAACERRMSRRFFFGVVAGGVAVAVHGGTPKPTAVVPHWSECSVMVETGPSCETVGMAARNEFLTVEKITNAMLKVLRDSSGIQQQINAFYNSQFDRMDILYGMSAIKPEHKGIIIGV